MQRDTNLDEVAAASQRVLALVRAACESWRFSSSLNQAVAASGLARAADLLDDAPYLAEHRQSVGANILVRAAFECWLVGAWALLGGDDALLGIERERARNEHNLADLNGLDERIVEYLDDQIRNIKSVTTELLGTAAPSLVKYEQMARALPSLIKDQTPDHEDVDVLAIYNLIYRSHSTYDAHPWKVLGQYVTETDRELRVKSAGPWQDPRISTALMTMYVAVLGRWIEHARDGDVADWETALATLEVLLRPE